MFRNANISQRLAVTIVPAVLALALCLVAMFLSLMQANDESQIRQMLSARSEIALRHFNYTYEKAMSNAAMIFSHHDMAAIYDDGQALKESKITMLRNRFSDLRKEQPYYREVYVINRFGNVLYYDNGQPFYDISFAQRLSGYALQANSQEASSPQAHMLSHNGEWIWVLALPVSHSKQSGYVVVVLDGSVIHQAVNDIDNVFIDFRGEDDIGSFGPLERAILSHRNSHETPRLKTEASSYRYAFEETPYGTIYSWVDLDGVDLSREGGLLRAIAISLFIMGLAVAWIWFALYRLAVQPIRQVKGWLNGVLNNTLTEKDVSANTAEFNQIGHYVQQVNSSLQHHNTHMEQLAYYDELTQLHNKQYVMSLLDSRIEDDLTQGNNLYAWVIDIKGFKRINSTHGHDVGDGVLRAVGARIRSSTEAFSKAHRIDESKLLTSRGASDEFMVMGIVDYKGDLGDALASALQAAIEAPLSVEGHTFSLHVVVGFAKGAEDPAEIYQNADIARHEAKQTGHGGLRYTEALKRRTQQNQEMVDDICRALEKKEFMLHYQPKLNLVNGKSTTFEALIRWPKGNGFISPGIFIPFAEDAGLIGDIDTYVMHKLVNDVSVLEDMGWRDFSVSFNISALRLMDSTFIEAMKLAIFEKNVRPNHIQIEITEHSLIDNIAESIVAIEKLKSIGISVALDDFGTGHSSLAYLKDLPIDVLKVDRTFIHNVNNENQKKVLLSHIVKIGQSLSMTIVAEGVETKEEYDIIKELGCEELQGYYFNKPMPLPSVIESFAKDNANHDES